MLKETPLARWGTPEDVAKVACFLVSPAAAFLTGQILRINGGRDALRDGFRMGIEHIKNLPESTRKRLRQGSHWSELVSTWLGFHSR